MSRRRNVRFRTQIIYIFLLTFISLLTVNILIFRSVRQTIDNVDSAYEGNRTLSEMREWLDSSHALLNDYLNTKDESVLNQFYLAVENYKVYIEPFEHTEDMTAIEARETDIYHLSNSYIRIANMAVLSKNSGDVTRYQDYQKQATQLHAYLTTYINNLNTQLFYTNSDSYHQMLKTSRYAEVFYAIILLLMGGVDICILLLLTRRLIDPLQKLAQFAQEVGEGNLDVAPVETTTYNEIGVVSSSFNRMVVSLKDYIEKFRKSVETESALREQSIQMEASVKDAQLKYLQAQINPHFLFNTLNAGAQLAMLENADQTYRYIHKVADFFRFKIKNDDNLSTIREELKIVDDYIYIINVRYAGSIHYTKTVDEGLLNTGMPSMILQPIVENCVKHGLHDVEWEKKIDLSVASEDDAIVISVRDNGIGMSQEIIEKVLHNRLQDEDYNNRKGGVGLDNVITRLKTYFGKEDIVEITSVGENMGTEIAFFIPKEVKEKTDVQDPDRR